MYVCYLELVQERDSTIAFNQIANFSSNEMLPHRETALWLYNQPYAQYSDIIMTATASQITGISKETSKHCVTGLCEGNPQVTGGFPSQRPSNTENVSICFHFVSMVTTIGAWPYYRYKDHLWSPYQTPPIAHKPAGANHSVGNPIEDLVQWSCHIPTLRHLNNNSIFTWYSNIF